MTEQRRIIVLLTVAKLIPMSALAWLGVRMLAQERDVDRQRRREALEVAAGRLAIDIDRRLQDIEERLAHGEGVRLLPTGLASSPELPILYQPEAPPELGPPAALATAEAAEFQRRDLAAAELDWGWPSPTVSLASTAGACTPKIGPVADLTWC
jgi:hypothetical protein